jgi:hypothetical protein
VKKILFILKRREDFNAKVHNKLGLSTGLYNSAKFMNDMLIGSGVESVLEVAIDNNCIDRLVQQHNPTHVIIEALWVVPQKFSVLNKLHPKVKWIIRLHSEMPFMAGEGMAMDWIGDYAKFKNIIIACNAPRMLREIGLFVGENKVIYLPNYYPQKYKIKKLNRDKFYVDVCCFGAVRPLKNHMVQAYAAIEFAEKLGKQLRFHTNTGRIEMNGDPVQNNLKGLFQHLHERGHQLINHQWTPREEFLQLCSQMDIGLQCSFSETFNIVGADLTSQGVPLIGSSEIPWSSYFNNADPTNSKDICRALMKAYKHPQLNVFRNQYHLKRYTNMTKKIWNKYFL